MASTTHDRDLKCNEPSLCIPRVFPNITEDRIWGVLDELELGNIERIDMVDRETPDGEPYQRVFIHFKEWNGMHTQGGMVRRRLLDGEEIKIVYDEPWFWKVSASRSRRPRPRGERPRPRIEFADPSLAIRERPRVERHATTTQRRRDSRRETLTFEDGDAAVAAQHAEEDALNAGLSNTTAAKLAVELASLPTNNLKVADTPPPPPAPLSKRWGSS
tara:strand:- start:74 stop:724 length:651 start_codon:yes stop_codon:yes gene_type:complete